MIAIDITGHRFGKLVANSLLSRQQADNLGLAKKHAHWVCACDCGNSRIATGNNLRSGIITACKACANIARSESAAAKIRLDVAGDRYGMLVAVRLDRNGTGQGTYWLFECDCGRQTSLRLKDVRSGNTLSCGCLKNAAGHVYGAPKIAHARPWRKTTQ